MKNIRNRKIYIKNKINTISMKLKEKFKLLMKSVFMQFGSAMTDKGINIIWDGDEDIKVGDNVYQETEDDNGEINYIAVDAGEYILEDGRTVVVDEESKVAEIREKEEEKPAEPAEPETPSNMEETPAPEAPADPTTEEVVTTDEEPFDAEKAYAELKSMYDALKGEVEVLKEQLGKLLEVPADEDAFKAAKKNQEAEQKGFLCKVAKK